MRIRQAYVAPSIRFFKEGFLKKYNLSDYNNQYEPTVFFGASESSSLIENHKGFKLILPCTPNDNPILTSYHNVFFICSDNYLLPNNVKRKSITPEIKEYSKLEPTPLGDKVYVYSGFKKGWSQIHENTIKELQKQIKFEIITTSHQTLSDYYNIDYLKSNFYDKCFVNLNFTAGYGLSTVIELGLMGRKTIFKPKYPHNIQRLEFPNFIHYNTMDDMINLILDESKKIGTIQPSINAHNVGDEWLNLDYWL